MYLFDHKWKVKLILILEVMERIFEWIVFLETNQGTLRLDSRILNGNFGIQATFKGFTVPPPFAQVFSYCVFIHRKLVVCTK